MVHKPKNGHIGIIKKHINITQILILIPKEDGRKKCKTMYQVLENGDYKLVEDFFRRNNVIDEEHYLNIIRACIAYLWFC